MGLGSGRGRGWDTVPGHPRKPSYAACPPRDWARPAPLLASHASSVGLWALCSPSIPTQLCTSQGFREIGSFRTPAEEGWFLYRVSPPGACEACFLPSQLAFPGLPFVLLPLHFEAARRRPPVLSSGVLSVCPLPL